MRERQQLKNLILLSFFVLICGGLLLPRFGRGVAHAEDKAAKRVLYISSYSPGFQTFHQQVDGIKSQFKSEGISLDIEFMDTKRFLTRENIENFKENITYKLRNMKPYDAIIVADDNGLSFMLDNQEELFKEIPIVFLGINDVEKAIRANNNPYITGVIESPSIKETIEIAKKINPNAKKVIALADNTPSGQADLATFKSISSEVPELTFESRSLKLMGFNTFGKELEKLNNDDIIILLSVYKDIKGEVKTFYEGLEFIQKHTTMPIYHPYYSGLDEGVLGGMVLSHNEQGKEAANIVIDILAGGKIENMTQIHKSPNKYIFDYNMVKQYGIDLSVFPKETLFINKERNFFEEYFYFVLVGVLIIAFQLLIIIGLVVNMRLRKVAECKLHKNKEDLLETNEELTATNEELSTINEELIAALEEIDIQDKKIYNLIYIDALTGLKNRYAINQFIDNIIHFHNLEHGLLAVMFLDIDNFKYINDTHGHDVGDKVIESIGKRLKDYTAEGVTIGRFGGDEFLLVINKENTDDIEKLIGIIQKICGKPIIIDKYKFFLTVSIGVSIYSDQCKKRRDLVKRADMALYKAKEAGKNTAVIYCEEMNHELDKKIELQSAIKEAMKNKEFYLNFQPYVDVESQQPMGVEALIRWKSKTLGFVSPYELIRNAEEMGLIVEIGEWVLRESCLFAKKLNKVTDKGLTVSVNISAIQLMDKDFYDRTVQIIEEVGVDPRDICLEMTETILIESLEAGTTLINRLMDYGIQIGLDDFGTGYSSLKYFRSLPANVLKIDKSFVDHITTNDYDYHLVNTMVEIAHMKGFSVVVEGVETKEQLAVLEKINCDAIQGYLFSRPLSEDDTLKFIKSKRNRI